MIDTARHFASVEEIKGILDVMAWTKLNIFHWHMTDSESFPFESKTHKTLQQGAFSPSTTYSYEDIQIITDYAMARGIHIIPEIDMPAHSHSWSVAHPELIVQYAKGCIFIT